MLTTILNKINGHKFIGLNEFLKTNKLTKNVSLYSEIYKEANLFVKHKYHIGNFHSEKNGGIFATNNKKVVFRLKNTNNYFVKVKV